MATLATVLLAISAATQHVPASSAYWWDARTAGWVGGIGGSVIGICGAVIGILSGLGRGRQFVLWFMRIVIVLGLLSLAAGIVALTRAQPYAVYYPLLLGGAITSGVIGFNYPGVRRRFQQIELRKMQAADIS